MVEVITMTTLAKKNIENEGQTEWNRLTADQKASVSRLFSAILRAKSNLAARRVQLAA